MQPAVDTLRARREPVWSLVGVAVQAGLVVWIIQAFQIESRPFRLMTVIAVGGLPLHALTPPSQRIWVFLSLTLVGIGATLGWQGGAWLVAIGLGLVGLCHLPVSFRMRLLLLTVAGAALTVLRADRIGVPWPRTVWPILGSMFAFRLVVYMYTVRHDATPVPWSRRLAYFFLLPNLALPLFPVVDFETFRDTYRCDRVAVVAERGAVSMTRGLLHLLLYRFVYHVGVLAASDVHNAIDLTRFLVSNFGLYLRISGLFHLAVGILQLYGFDLPLTHYRYFLATGMNDFWRRVNIYWKDFMLKVFFYPAYFRLRRWRQRSALALATVCVVIVTWALHIYQRFWVTGRFAFIWQDAVFWGVLGVAMIGSTVFESRRTRLRGVRRRTWTAGKAWRQAIEIVLTFTGITVLWSLWTCSSFAEWKGMWVAGAAMNAATRHRLSAGALAVAVALVACVMLPRPVFVARMAAAFSRVRQTAHARTWAAAARVGALVLLLLLVRPAVYLPLGGQTAAIIHSVRNAGMNAVDAQRAREGYYEELLDTHHLGSHLAEVQALRPRNWNAVHTSRGAAAPLNYELIPSLHVTLNAAELRTNRWGMRDGDYARDKPPGVLRIAVLGSSVTMGAGVEDKETYEALLEADLRRDGMRVESLNFAVFGYSALQNLIVLETKVLPFHPDVLLYATHDIEEALLVRNLVPVVGQPLRDTYPELRTVIEQAGVVGASPAVARWRLTPYAPRLLAWAFQRMVAVCRQHGIAPLAVFIPTLARGADGFDAAPSLRPLAEAGFETIDLSDVFSGYDAERLQLAPWDEHPNALGHRLIADRLHQELVPPESVLQRVYAHVASGAEAHANDARNE